MTAACMPARGKRIAGHFYLSATLTEWLNLAKDLSIRTATMKRLKMMSTKYCVIRMTDKLGKKVCAFV